PHGINRDFLASRRPGAAEHAGQAGHWPGPCRGRRPGGGGKINHNAAGRSRQVVKAGIDRDFADLAGLLVNAGDDTAVIPRRDFFKQRAAHPPADALQNDVGHGALPFQNRRARRPPARWPAGPASSYSFRIPKSRIAVSSWRCTPSSGSHIGSRSGPAAQPSRFIAHFTGIGFTSANRACTSGSASSCILRQRATSPANQAAHRSWVYCGATLLSTLITPLPPS